MAMTLYIAEKKDMATKIADALGPHSRQGDALVGQDFACIWCRGHLVAQAMPEDYAGEDWGEWKVEGLPMVPKKWEYKPEKGSEALLENAVRWMGDPRVDLVVNACDADREGEGIFRRVAAWAGCSKHMLRFWSTATTSEAMRRDLASMKPLDRFDRLADAADGRAKADWIIGLSATKAYTSLYRARFRCGRVMSAVLAMVVERTRASRGFSSAPFWTVEASFDVGGGFCASTERYDARPACEADLACVQAAGSALVRKAEYKRVPAKPPALYDLTALQRDASRVCGLTADETLGALESLYLEGLATYPRTDSRHISSDDAERAAGWIAQAAAAFEAACGPCGWDARASDCMRMADDSKVSGHGAVCPTELSAGKLAELSGAKRSVMLLVVARFLAASMPPAAKRRASLELEAGGVALSASSTEVVEASWIAVDEAARRELSRGEGEEKSDRPLPEGLEPGMSLPIASAQLREGKTRPPKLFTDDTLLAAMAQAGKSISDAELRRAIDDDASHSGGLGTPATRAEMIEKLLSLGYIERDKKALASTPRGEAISDATDATLTTPELTARWEKELSDVEHGLEPLSDFMSGIESYAVSVVEGAKASFDPARRSAIVGVSSVGSCPRCGAPVVDRGPKSKKFDCSSNRGRKDPETGEWVAEAGCGFSMWKTCFGKKLTTKQAASLLAGKAVAVKGCTSKAGKRFDVTARLKPDGSFETEFLDSSKKGGKVAAKGSGARRAGGARRW